MACKKLGVYGKISIVLLVATFVVLIAFWRHAHSPFYVTGRDVPDAAKVGDVEAAMAQSRKLLAGLRTAEWKYDPNVIPKELLFLPDRKNSEDASARGDRQASFTIPTTIAAENDIAFYSEIYRRRNMAHLPGYKTDSHPSGFYIVGYKDGEVKKVAVGDVRIAPSGTKGVGPVYVFPGMAKYSPTLPKLPYVDNSKQNLDEIIKQISVR